MFHDLWGPMFLCLCGIPFFNHAQSWLKQIICPKNGAPDSSSSSSWSSFSPSRSPCGISQWFEPEKSTLNPDPFRHSQRHGQETNEIHTILKGFWPSFLEISWNRQKQRWQWRPQAVQCSRCSHDVGVWKTQFTGIGINIVSLRKIEGPVWHVYVFNILFILIYLLVLERLGSLY